MIFYLCETEPPQLVGTQADARATGAKWEQHDVPVDKAGLMAYVNALMSTSEKPVQVSETPDAPDLVADWRLAHGECPTCFRTKEASESLSRSFEIGLLETEVDKVWDPAVLREVLAFTNERLAFVTV